MATYMRSPSKAAHAVEAKELTENLTIAKHLRSTPYLFAFPTFRTAYLPASEDGGATAYSAQTKMDRIRCCDHGMREGRSRQQQRFQPSTFLGARMRSPVFVSSTPRAATTSQPLPSFPTCAATAAGPPPDDTGAAVAVGAPPLRTSKTRATSTRASARSSPVPAPPAEQLPVEKYLDVIICHIRADFDSIGAAVGLSKLRTIIGANKVTKTKRNRKVRIVLCGGEDNSAKTFMSLYRNEFSLADWKTVKPETIRWVGVVDTQSFDRLGNIAEWLHLPGIKVSVYDHHISAQCDIPYTELTVEPVGSSTTIIVELLQKTASELAVQDLKLTPSEATVMALGIHADTGSLTYPNTTARDARALAWLIEMGASQREVSSFQHQSLSEDMQHLLNFALRDQQTILHHGYRITYMVVRMPKFLHGLARVCYTVLELTGADAVIMGALAEEDEQLSIIGRAHARIEVDLATVFRKYKGGGHQRAAAASVHKCSDPEEVMERVVKDVLDSVAPPPTAIDIMSTPVFTIRSTAPMSEADALMTKMNCSGLIAVDEDGNLMGIITSRDVQMADINGMLERPVKAFMCLQPMPIAPDTSLLEIETLLTDARNRVGRLPVQAENGEIIGVVTRSDVLRTRLQEE